MAQALSLTDAIEEQPNSLLNEISNTAVINAARQLIARHRGGQSFDIEALDVPHRALSAIAEKLEELGASYSLSSPLIEALRGYVMESGGAFARAVNAKPVMIRMAVSPEMPACRFDNGMTELACLGTNEAKVEGSSSINVRATPTGTATTSNSANVDAMFANVKGLHLWIRFESPTRADIDALLSTMESTLAGIAQSVGGAMGAEDLKKLMIQLEQDGSLTPALMDLISKVILLQEGMKTGGLSGDNLRAALADITSLMQDLQSNNLAPAALMQALMTSIAALPANQAILSFLTEQGFQNILADNDNNSADFVEAQNVSENLLAMLEDIASQIESGQIELSDLPPELAVLMDAIGGVEAILDQEGRTARLEALTEALVSENRALLAESIHSAIIALTDPETIAMLPPSIADRVQDFMHDNPVLPAKLPVI